MGVAIPSSVPWCFLLFLGQTNQRRVNLVSQPRFFCFFNTRKRRGRGTQSLYPVRSRRENDTLQAPHSSRGWKFGRSRGQ